MIDFYQRVENIRKYHGLNKKEFADKLSVTGSNYATLLKGKTANGELAITLHNLFNVNLNWLLTGTGKMYNKNIPCNTITLARATIEILIKHNAIEGMPKNSGYLGGVGLESVKELEELSTYKLEEMKKRFKIVDAKRLTYSKFINSFGGIGTLQEQMKDIENKLYHDDTVLIIENISQLKETEEKKVNIIKEFIKILDDAHIKGVEPLGNLIFIDTASFLDINYSHIGAYVTSNFVSNSPTH